ncbi:hypothetical protein SFRURICE_016099 [Spodoptera frugiperda]|nr:hypothetical protein SFRURICE_016099 [Spodoptera frugiperda]
MLMALRMLGPKTPKFMGSRPHQHAPSDAVEYRRNSVATGDDFVDEKAILARRMHSLRVVTELSKAPTCGQIASVGADSFDETDTSRPTTNARPNVGTNAIF